MKYLLFLLIFFLVNCSFNKKNSYWSDDSVSLADYVLVFDSTMAAKKPVDNVKLSEIFKKENDLKSMTFSEFNLYLQDYTNNSDYPDINN
ncbi:hypothetical protein N9I08_04620 [Candidatus Pelagibacter sp.]|jgi:hypothetical protein|nr:hypothetical protein [Candidatus Pelagibacter sp.]